MPEAYTSRPSTSTSMATSRGIRTALRARSLDGLHPNHYNCCMEMTREQLLGRIWIDPARCAGKPCIRGHRIWVSLILDLLASGESIDDILTSYPGLTEDDIRACLAYGSEMARERFVDIPLEAS